MENFDGKLSACSGHFCKTELPRAVKVLCEVELSGRYFFVLRLYLDPCLEEDETMD
jgi:hypothetical protein